MRGPGLDSPRIAHVGRLSRSTFSIRPSETRSSPDNGTWSPAAPNLPASPFLPSRETGLRLSPSSASSPRPTPICNGSSTTITNGSDQRQHRICRLPNRRHLHRRKPGVLPRARRFLRLILPVLPRRRNSTNTAFFSAMATPTSRVRAPASALDIDQHFELFAVCSRADQLQLGLLRAQLRVPPLQLGSTTIGSIRNENEFRFALTWPTSERSAICAGRNGCFKRGLPPIRAAAITRQNLDTNRLHTSSVCDMIQQLRIWGMESICPFCGCGDVRRSRRALHEKVLTLITLMRPYRCHLCNLRFFRPIWFHKSNVFSSRR